MRQTIQKLSQDCERWLRELLTKYTLLLCGFSIVVAVVILLSLDAQVKEAEKIRSIIYAVGAALAASMTFVQWASGRSVKRAELVDQLIEKITAIDPNSLMEDPESGNTKELEKQDQEFGAKLSFLSYIAYLEATGILSDDEFNALRLDLVRILEHEKVSEMIEEACNGNKDSKYIPYFYLVKYGAENCKSDSVAKYKKILASRNDQTREGERESFSDFKPQEHLLNPDNSKTESPVSENVGYSNEPIEKETNEKEANEKTAEVIDSVSSGKTYDTHLDVLNGIFKFSYRAHMRAGATLPDGREVWFPKYYDSVSQPIQAENRSDWINILNAKEGIILEYWPDGIEPKEKTWNKNYRYVFGKNLIPQNRQGRLTYRFLGIYKFANREGNHFVYKRYSDKLLKADVERYLKTDNF